MTEALGPVTVNVGLPTAKITEPVPVPLRPAISTTLPLVVVMVALLTFTLFAAFMLRPPSVVVMAAGAFIFISRPAFIAILPLVPVMAEFTFTSLLAFRVRVVGRGVAVQLTASFTKMSPLPVVVA